MTKLTRYQKTRQTMLKKYGSEEALKAHYRQMQQKSQVTYDPIKHAQTVKDRYGKDYFSKIGSKGGHKSSRKGVKNGEKRK